MHDVGPLFCFDPFVSGWARLAIEHSAANFRIQLDSSSSEEMYNHSKVHTHSMRSGAFQGQGAGLHASDDPFKLHQIRSVPTNVTLATPTAPAAGHGAAGDGLGVLLRLFPTQVVQGMSIL
jgi:hypothetical protein